MNCSTAVSSHIIVKNYIIMNIIPAGSGPSLMCYLYRQLTQAVSCAHSIQHRVYNAIHILPIYIGLCIGSSVFATKNRPFHCYSTHNYRVLGSVWVLFVLSALTRHIYATHFAGSPHTARITATITPT